MSNVYRPIIDKFGLQSNSNQLFATWLWDKPYTESYQAIWYYDTGDGVWFVGSDSTTEDKQSLYSPPENAKFVQFIVKAISETRTVNDVETSYWVSEWSTAEIYSIGSNPPEVPSGLSVSIKQYQLRASVSNYNSDATGIEFQVVKNDSTIYKTGNSIIKASSAAYNFIISAGSRYKVRCRAYKGSVYSDWSEYTDNNNTVPSSPVRIKSLEAQSTGSVKVSWDTVSNATGYTVEYATEKYFFDHSSNTQSSSISTNVGYMIISGMDTGDEYFFRLRADNEVGSSPWTGIKSIILGEKPSPPTTWSSTSIAMIGEPLYLYWMHNSKDGSSEKTAKLFLDYGPDDGAQIIEVKNTRPDSEKDNPTRYEIDTSSWEDGFELDWKVTTAGVTGEMSEFSTLRTIKVYAPPSLEVAIHQRSSGNDPGATRLTLIRQFPFYIYATPSPESQIPISYYVKIIADSSYTTLDNVGNEKVVNSGDCVYSGYFNPVWTTGAERPEPLVVKMSAGDVNLDNNIVYTVIVTVSMNSGLTAESTADIRIGWNDDQYEPTAEIAYNSETATVNIHPYCANEKGVLISDVILSVYRREFDGTFTELAKNIQNGVSEFITDPHPSLDYARYRIVAITESTGAVSFTDLPGYPIHEICIIIQWDEKWTNFDTTNPDVMKQPAWTGSMLKLPYNIDVNDNNSRDVEMVNYIGREYPVSYYGTHIGSTASWSTVIPKYDKDTLYALRRLQRYMGDVYVREPSGSGYWAKVDVSFSQTHCELTIPITLDITRVSGGV